VSERQQRAHDYANTPPTPKKSQQLALGMPIDCGTEYANRCGENVESVDG